MFCSLILFLTIVPATSYCSASLRTSSFSVLKTRSYPYLRTQFAFANLSNVSFSPTMSIDSSMFFLSTALLFTLLSPQLSQSFPRALSFHLKRISFSMQQKAKSCRRHRRIISITRIIFAPQTAKLFYYLHLVALFSIGSLSLQFNTCTNKVVSY